MSTPQTAHLVAVPMHEAARRVGKSESRIRQLVEGRLIAHVRVGTRVLLLTHDVAAFQPGSPFTSSSGAEQIASLWLDRSALTAKQLAQALGVSDRLVHRLVRGGELPALVQQPQIILDPAVVRAWLLAQRMPSRFEKEAVQ